MAGTTTYGEFRHLLEDAVSVLGEKRVALGAGCHPSSIRPWLRRNYVQLTPKTTGTILPRLRSWTDWVPGYLAARDELRRLEVDAMACWENRADELRTRLEDAWDRYPLFVLALGCEVPESRLLAWRMGIYLDKYLDDLVRALAHLRHLDSWPVPPVRVPAAIGPA